MKIIIPDLIDYIIDRKRRPLYCLVMKMINESIFSSSLRAFFVTLFGALGILVGFGILIFLLVGIFSSGDEKSFGHGINILPDANGSRKELSSSAPVILQIDIDDEIGKDGITAEKIEEILLDSREEEFKGGRVKGILLNINTPGGGANETNIIYRHLKEYKQLHGVPIFTFVNGLCASGGYYLACATDKIFASEVSLIGSVGVVSWPPFFNIVEAMEKIGISATTLSAGSGKDAMNPTRAWTVDEQKNRQELIDFYYGDFVNSVISNRPQVSQESLTKEHGANVFPAYKAKHFGLIDETVSSRNDALKALVSAAGIDGEYQVVSFKTKSWWKELLKEKAINSPLLTGRIKHELLIPKTDPYSYLYIP